MTPAQFYQLEQQNQQNQQVQAQQNTQNMMGAIGDIAGAYMKSEEQMAKGRAFKNTFKVLAPALNMTTDKLAQVVGTESLKNDNDWFHASEAFMPILPSLINLQLGQDRLGVQQQAPFLDAALKNKRDLGAGNVPHGGGGGMAPVEPPLPPMSQAGPVDQAPSAAAPQAPSMPGGQASRDLLNRDRAKRGLPPI